ncbi:Uncharacterized protein FWK35_00011558 [Aphis craccivora]|uniref:Uncharacterized protein n=1 Tax=Aphis craccivora TaxID=307492 RepID=A0A6G0ZK90_APHCR|nr:Uncharacterized protein FWK35_00011558 [Aphis craccivora]
MIYCTSSVDLTLQTFKIGLLVKIKSNKLPTNMLDTLNRCPQIYAAKFIKGMKTPRPPVCSSCGTPLTAKHIITEFRSYEKERKNSDFPDHLSDAFRVPTHVNPMVIAEKRKPIVDLSTE